MLRRMDENGFWRLIEDCKPGVPDPDAEHLAATPTTRLAAGPPPVVTGFAEQLSWALYRLDRREYGRELSGDAFLYMRAAVVAAGREVYDRVLREPAEFVPYAIGLVWAESLLYVPDRAYEQITGEEWDRGTCHSYESYSNADGWAGPWPHLARRSGRGHQPPGGQMAGSGSPVRSASATLPTTSGPG